MTGFDDMPNQFDDLKSQLLTPGRIFTMEEVRAIVNHIFDECVVDTDDRFHNIFFYEICPLLKIAEHVGNANTRIGFTGSDSCIDGIIFFEGACLGQKVEMTAAIDGVNHALQMELLKKRGHAPAFAKIQATGTKRTRRFGQNQTLAVNPDEYNRETLFPLLKGALARKTDKARTNEHYTNAWLGIVFEDVFIHSQPPKNKMRYDKICCELLDGGPVRHSPFNRVFCIGVSRKYIFDSQQLQ